ncbi:hypothetical protein [Mycoplasmopsis agalactiae]|uniref:hypothetical protein n=1 Tax=Mycoplasmopsis agalactiae TaxID=2110 RepID=UPI001F446BA3|nr:hypothetical protein [Mycoplasmopsis agalactiae]
MKVKTSFIYSKYFRNTGNGGAATTTEKKPLPTLISSKNQQLGEIKKKDKNSVLEALLAKINH